MCVCGEIAALCLSKDPHSLGDQLQLAQLHIQPQTRMLTYLPIEDTVNGESGTHNRLLLSFSGLCLSVP